jgi:hypothetical protein
MKQVYRERTEIEIDREREMGEIRPSLVEPELVGLEAIGGSVGEGLR